MSVFRNKLLGGAGVYLLQVLVPMASLVLFKRLSCHYLSCNLRHTISIVAGFCRTWCRRTLLTVFVAALTFSVHADMFAEKLSAAAIERTNHSVVYDGSYRRIGYPQGDVPAHIGVCTDVVIRSYRALGVDLQKLVHEDMNLAFAAYPSTRIWGLTKTDPNIDHRRVPNLQAFFRRHGKAIAISEQPIDYKAGDIVTWMLPGNLPHIGIVVSEVSSITNNPLVVHNIGAGPKKEDGLFKYQITGHYRYEVGR